MGLTIGVAMTCFSRREQTLEAIKHLYASSLPASVSLQVFLTDDGSSDGTADAVRRSYPLVTILHGNGSLFWNGGMRSSLAAAYASGVNFVLWLNDDSLLTPTAIQELLDTELRCATKTGKPVVVVATTCDIATGEVSYGGVIFPVWWRRTTPRIVHSAVEDVECESVNGNIVLVPREIYQTVGNLDAAFIHGLGDFDYGFRVRRAGYSVYSAKGIHGFCSRNSHRGTFQDASLPIGQRWRLICGPKGRPPRQWAIFTRRHCGSFWPLYFIWPYFFTLITWAVARVKRTA